jgi:hypothetical protein
VIQGKPGEATTIEFSKTALEEAAVRTSVEDVLASGKAGDACGKEATDRYIGAAYGDRRACLAAQKPGSAARSVSVTRIEIAGAGAKAVAVPNGGPSDGQTITVSLISQGGVWKVDAISSSAPVGP